MHSIVKLAKTAIESYIQSGLIISPPTELTHEMKEKAGVFVSLKKHGQLRGCIGTFEPITESVANEIIKNALSAAMKDPRFQPVRPDELYEITYSVDILSPPEKIYKIEELDSKEYGVIVVEGYRKGLLLPNLEGVDTVERQLGIAKQKAGIFSDNDKIDIYRFKVRRYF